MNQSTHRSFSRFVMVAACLALGVPAATAQDAVVPGQASRTAGILAGEHKKIEGTITGRDEEKLALRLTATNGLIAVKLSGLTQIREKKVNPFRRSRKYVADQLIPGLVVEVEGHGDSAGALVADKITLTNDDLKMARLMDARVAPVEENERKMSGQIAELDSISNAARGGAKAAQATADEAHLKIAALDDYEPVHNVTIHFKVGSAVLSEDARRSLDGLAKEALSLKGYVIEVAGFASSEGTPALNQRLSRQRAEAVSEYLAEKHDVPLRRIMTPTGYGVSHPVSDNSTRAGREENRRVEVRVLVSRGLSARKDQDSRLPQ